MYFSNTSVENKISAPFMAKIQKLLLCKCHESVNLLRWSFEIVDGECVYGNAVDVNSQANLQNLRTGNF